VGVLGVVALVEVCEMSNEAFLDEIVAESI